ncbi:MAG: hypothetical protein EOP45_15135 [Sphingobacteriaceae bacterium]|nr:MAG: hypothetical protein EOP45_15135 [Sphingobacteriaceae bacterium]
MITQIDLNTEQDIVKNLRLIRDQINLEIKDMTFEQERAYLDQLLADKTNTNAKNDISRNGNDR